MRKIKTFIELIKNRQFKLIAKKVYIRILLSLYRIRAQIEDRRYGGISADKIKASRYRDKGAYTTESTNYIWLDKIFKSYPLKGNEVFVDVGCGEGRVLTYLHSKKFCGELIGIELDPDVATTASSRAANCTNIRILAGDFRNYKEVIKGATAIYLFNPFNASVLKTFIELIESCVDHQLILYYCNDVHRHILDKRNNWTIVRRDTLKIAIHPTRNYTVYRYR